MEISSNYIKSSTVKPPKSQMLLNQAALPISIVVQPFQYQDELPQANFKGENIVRCVKCKSYINMYVELLDNAWICNLCRHMNQGTPEVSIELSVPNYEINAPESYMKKPPMPSTFLFLVDVSRSSKTFANICLNAITSAIEHDGVPGSPRTQVSLIAYADKIHIFALDSFEIYTVDPSDPFLPVPKSRIMCDLEEIKPNLLSALYALQSFQSSNTVNSLRQTIELSETILKDNGGKVLLFIGENYAEATSSSFNLKSTTEYYQNVSKQLARNIIIYDVFVFANQYCNASSFADLAKYTGGDFYYYPHLDDTKVAEDVWNSISNSLYWECALRTRVSIDWMPNKVYGHFDIFSENILEMAAMNPFQTITYFLKMHNAVVSQDYLYIQSAIMYTNTFSERKIRVLNARFLYANNLEETYASIDFNVLLNAFAKICASEIIFRNDFKIGRQVLEFRCREFVLRCKDIWRKLPDSIDSFILAVLGLTHAPIFSFKINQSNNHSDSKDVDLFNYMRFKLDSIAVDAIYLWAYPCLYRVDRENEVLNLRKDVLDSSGVYLIDNGFELIGWKGKFYVWNWSWSRSP